MAPRSKIVDEQEVLRWFADGLTYQEMADRYRVKYNIETTLGMWSNFRRKRGLARRTAQNDELLPWRLNEEHKLAYPAMMLRFEARRRAGLPNRDREQDLVARWVQDLLDKGLVVDYDPSTADGFKLVPREPGDVDIVRAPARRTGKRRISD